MSFRSLRTRGPLNPVIVSNTDVTVALTGAGATASAGLLGVALAVALAGSAATSAAGTLTPSATVAVSGSAGTSAAGTVTASNDGSAALTGSSATTQAGTVVASGSASGWVLKAHTFVIGNTNSATTSTFVSTGADVIIVAVGSYSGAAVTNVTDNQTPSNTYIELTEQVDVDERLRLYYASPATGPFAVGAGHTVTANGSFIYPSLCVQAWSGSRTTGPLGQQSGAHGGPSITSLALASIIPVEDNELIVTAINGPEGANIDGGFTISDTAAGVPGQSYPCIMAYLVQTTALSVSPTWSFTTTHAAAVMATFRMSGTGATPLVGSSATASAGTLVPSASKGLSGSAGTPAAGTLTAAPSVAVSGTTFNAFAGVVTPSGGTAFVVIEHYRRHGAQRPFPFGPSSVKLPPWENY